MQEPPAHNDDIEPHPYDARLAIVKGQLLVLTCTLSQSSVSQAGDSWSQSDKEAEFDPEGSGKDYDPSGFDQRPSASFSTFASASAPVGSGAAMAMYCAGTIVGDMHVGLCEEVQLLLNWDSPTDRGTGTEEGRRVGLELKEEEAEAGLKEE